MTRPIALVTGVTGQDGSYLAELLLSKGYVVHGVKRRASQFNTQRVDHIYEDPHAAAGRFFLHYGDLTDATNLIRIIQEAQPTEIYNLGAQSHVAVSFETPEYTANSDAVGALRLLEAIAHPRAGQDLPLLPGLHLRALRQGPERAAGREHALLSALALCGGQALRLLDRASTIARPMACTPPTASCSIMRARRAARLS